MSLIHLLLFFNSALILFYTKQLCNSSLTLIALEDRFATALLITFYLQTDLCSQTV